MYYIDFKNAENYVNTIYKNIKNDVEACEILNKELLNLKVQYNLINQVNADFVSYLERLININRKHSPDDPNDSKKLINEIIDNIKRKIDEVEVNLKKAASIEIDVFKETSENKELNVYRRLAKFNKQSRFIDFVIKDDCIIFSEQLYKQSFIYIYYGLIYFMQEVSLCLDLYKKFVNDEIKDFDDPELKKYGSMIHELPRFIKKSNDENDYNIYLTYFIKKLSQINDSHIIKTNNLEG